MTQPQLTHLECDLTGDPLPVRTALRVVSDALAGGPACPDPGTVRTVTSELVTDAVQAGAGLLVLHVEVGLDRLEVGVVDDVGHRPPPDAERIRRLRVVEDLASRTGERQLPHRTWRWAVITEKRSPAVTARTIPSRPAS